MRRSPFAHLLKPSLVKHVETVHQCIAQGLDIYIFASCPIVRRSFADILGRELCHKQCLLCNCLPSAKNEMRQQEKEKTFLPIVIVSNETIEPGQGFVIHELPMVRKLGLSTSCIVDRLLHFYNRECLLDNFDGNILKILKNIHSVNGLPALVDAIRQLIFTLSGDDQVKGIIEILEPYQEGRFYDSHREQEDLSPQLLSSTLESLISQSAFPLDYLKSLISWYVVHKKHQSLKQASHQLGVARSTLQVHLKRAHQLDIQKLFNS